MARPKIQPISNTCKNCSCEFFTIPSKKREFCTKPCAQQFKGKDKSWLEKREQTCLTKYGTKVAISSEEVKNKYKHTLIEKYGVDNPFSSIEIREKSKQTIKNKYGFEVASKNEEVKKKLSQSLKGIVKNRKNYVEIKWEKIVNYCEINNFTPLFDKQYLEDNKVNHSFKNKFEFICNRCQETTSVYLSNGYLPSCKCSNYKGYSLIEDELYVFLRELFEENQIFTNRRDILKNRMELDFYIPHINMAIEVNGIYWHSESMGKYRDYHLFKTKECEDKGISLIHILDYEWLFKQDIVKSILLSRFKLLSNKIYARKCEVREIKDTKLIREFLDKNHIQGYTHASTSLGLYYNNELVSVMTFSKNRFNKSSNEYEMVRFCNKLYINVVGGASKLFTHFIKTYNNFNIVSFADRRWFNGNLYNQLEFDFIKFTSPSYFYWKDNKILSRMSCQKHKLEKLLENFNSKKTEYQNMLDHGYRRVWDCGNYKFIYKNKGAV
jgi:hypothetical protein